MALHLPGAPSDTRARGVVVPAGCQRRIPGGGRRPFRGAGAEHGPRRSLPHRGHEVIEPAAPFRHAVFAGSWHVCWAAECAGPGEGRQPGRCRRRWAAGAERRDGSSARGGGAVGDAGGCAAAVRAAAGGAPRRGRGPRGACRPGSHGTAAAGRGRAGAPGGMAAPWTQRGRRWHGLRWGDPHQRAADGGNIAAQGGAPARAEHRVPWRPGPDHQLPLGRPSAAVCQRVQPGHDARVGRIVPSRLQHCREWRTPHAGSRDG
mmetsp:Transcript_19543/g.49156  ORF Transcript_19543/g.49156 Transcript_19543/m.49156 type:complete len:261 (-) Transcript_19543:140-922(-)